MLRRIRREQRSNGYPHLLSYTGWWFGTFGLFFHRLEIILPTVVWNINFINFMTFHMLGIVTPTDQLIIFFRGVGQPPTMEAQEPNSEFLFSVNPPAFLEGNFAGFFQFLDGPKCSK